MITYKAGPLINFVRPIEREFFEFMMANTDGDKTEIRLRFEDNFLRNTYSNVVLAFDDRKLIGFYIWRAFAKSEFLKGNPKLEVALNAKGFEVSDLYNPIMLMVHSEYRRQGISTEMANRAAEMAAKAGFKARLFYFVGSDTVAKQRDANHAGKMVDIDFDSEISGKIHVLPLDV